MGIRNITGTRLCYLLEKTPKMKENNPHCTRVKEECPSFFWGGEVGGGGGGS